MRDLASTRSSPTDDHRTAVADPMPSRRRTRRSAAHSAVRTRNTQHSPEPFSGGAPTACKHMVSGTLSLRSSRCLSSFSRLTGSLSVVEEYLALEGGPPIFKPGFPSPILLDGQTRLRLQDFHLLRCVIQTLRSSSGSSAFARRYLRNRCCFLFLWILRCFSSPRSPFTPMHSE